MEDVTNEFQKRIIDDFNDSYINIVFDNNKNMMFYYYYLPKSYIYDYKIVNASYYKYSNINNCFIIEKTHWTVVDLLE